jgi:peptidoglycan hydrolase-like protein with peptidoglycan-binding domain
MPTPKPGEVAAARPTTGSRTLQTASTRRNDPIADLIGSSVGSSSRVMAVQRALAEFGYGQIKPSGVIDAPTSVAIEKFESEHKLPATGRLSDRLLNELANLTGRPIE